MRRVSCPISLFGKSKKKNWKKEIGKGKLEKGNWKRKLEKGNWKILEKGNWKKAIK